MAALRLHQEPVFGAPRQVKGNAARRAELREGFRCSDSNNDALFDAFKATVESDKFRITHIDGIEIILDRDDLDIRRLIEAMAMFTARTYLMGERSIRRSHTRLFQQHFSYSSTQPHR